MSLQRRRPSRKWLGARSALSAETCVRGTQPVFLCRGRYKEQSGQNIPDTSNYTADPSPNDRDADGSVLIYGEVARLELNTGSGFVVHNWGSWGEHCGYCVCTDV